MAPRPTRESTTPRAGFLARLRSTPDGILADSDLRVRDGLVRALVRVRRRRGYTQEQAAQRMSTTQSAISDLENGIADARLSTLQKYSRVLGCSLELVLREGLVQHFTSWEERSLAYKANSRTKVLKGDASAWGFGGGVALTARAGVPVRLQPPDNVVSVLSAPEKDGFVRSLDEAASAA